MPKDLGLESGLIGVNLHCCLHPAEPGRSELPGRLLIPVCQRLTSCPERVMKTAFSQQHSGELGILPSLGRTHYSWKYIEGIQEERQGAANSTFVKLYFS